MVPFPLIWLLIASILISSWLAWRARREEDAPAARPFTMLMAISALIALLYAIEISLSSPDQKILLTQIRLVFQPFLAPAVALLVIEYLGWVTWLTRPRLVLLFFIPLITALLSLSGAYHELFRYNFRIDAAGPVAVLFFERGPWWWVYYFYSMGVFFGSCALLLGSFRIRSLRYRNSLILASGILLVVFVDILYVLKLTPIPGYYWTPSFILVTGSLFAWIILRGGLFETSAVARDAAWEHMQDLALMLDPKKRLIDFNNSAQMVIGLTPASIGQDLSALPEEWKEVLLRCTGSYDCQEEIHLGTGRGRRVYELSITAVRDWRQRVVGRMFLFHDISERTRNNQIILEALEEKEMLLKEIHHRVKNNLTVVSSLLELQAMASQDERLRIAFQDSQQRIQAMIGIHQLLYQSKNMAEIEMGAYIRNLTDEMQRLYASKDVALSVDVRDVSLAINQAIPCGLIINELVTNAYKYGFIVRSSGDDSILSPVVEGQSSILVQMHTQTGDAGDTQVVLRVENNGQVLPASFDIQSSKSLGLRLVRQLTSQLDGKLQVESGPQETTFILEFPLNPSS